MISKTLKTATVVLVFLLAAPGAFASSLTYGAVNNVGPGHHSFSKAHGFWEGHFSDAWRFSLAEGAKVSVGVKDFEWAIGHFKIFNNRNLEVQFAGRTSPEGMWLHAVLDPGVHTYVVNADVGGIFGVYKGALKVSAVPLPASAWLFLSALAGLLVIRRRQQPQAAAA